MIVNIFIRNSILLAALLLPLIGICAENLGGFFAEAEEKIQLENRLRQVRINAKVREAELLAENELQKKRDAIAKPVRSQSDIPISPPRWADLVQKPEYKAMSPKMQAEAKAAYFDYWIAPLVGTQADELRIKFLDDKAANFQGAVGLFLGALAMLCLSLFLYGARSRMAQTVKAIRLMRVTILKNSKEISSLLIAVAILTVAARVILGPPLVLFVR